MVLDRGDGSMDGWMKPGRLGRGKGQRGGEADTRTTRGGGRRLRAVCEVEARVLSTDLEITGPLGGWAGQCWGSHLPEAACGWAPTLGEGQVGPAGREGESESEVAQSCPTLWGPMDCSPPSSSVHGTSQA